MLLEFIYIRLIKYSMRQKKPGEDNGHIVSASVRSNAAHTGSVLYHFYGFFLDQCNLTFRENLPDISNNGVKCRYL